MEAWSLQHSCQPVATLPRSPTTSMTGMSIMFGKVNISLLPIVVSNESTCPQWVTQFLPTTTGCQFVLLCLSHSIFKSWNRVYDFNQISYYCYQQMPYLIWWERRRWNIHKQFRNSALLSSVGCCPIRFSVSFSVVRNASRSNGKWRILDTFLMVYPSQISEMSLVLHSILL